MAFTSRRGFSSDYPFPCNDAQRASFDELIEIGYKFKNTWQGVGFYAMLDTDYNVFACYMGLDGIAHNRLAE